MGDIGEMNASDRKNYRVDDDVIEETGKPVKEALTYDLSHFSDEDIDAMISENIMETIILFREFMKRKGLDRVKDEFSIDTTVAFNLAKIHLNKLNKPLPNTVIRFLDFLKKEEEGELDSIEESRQIHGLNLMDDLEGEDGNGSDEE